MKKTLVVLLVLVSAFAVFADTYTSSKGTADAEFDPNKQVEFVQQTSKANPVITIGTLPKGLLSGSVGVTSFGQSTDAAMVNTCLKRIKGINFTYGVQMTASEVAKYKTLVIAVGGSTKGLGAAGISEADERKRCQDIMEVVKKNGIKVIFVHIGGSSRRGIFSDELADMVLPYAQTIILKEDANFDYKFTKYASDNNVSITLIYSDSGTVKAFTALSESK